MPAIRVQAWNAARASLVFRDLDLHDRAEAQLARAYARSWPELYADWREARGLWLVSHVLATRGNTPFAVAAMIGTSQRGVAEAAFLARNHLTFRREIAAAGLLIRHKLPRLARAHGIRRIEARCWADHPTAGCFLGQLGFTFEARLRGFGPDGDVSFDQYAFITTDH